ncbi:MAG TPA: sigma-70 family RNA polymerase sigma factor [Armatimonadota bacterium]|nr:sigma-70 family RNA polymerase sigma factor [Armatimonadota bacterium]
MPFEAESDRELVSKFVEGDNAAFEALHRRYYAKVYRLAYLKTNNADDAEDIASETWCRAFQSLKQYRFESGDSVYPWLYRITVNLCIDLSRDKSSHQVVSLDAQTADGVRTFLESIEDTKPSPYELVEKQEVQQLVRSAIANLPVDQQEVIVHRFSGEMAYQEIAQAMHRSDGAVRSLLHRGLVSLRAEVLNRLSEAERLQMLGGKEETHVRGDSIRIHGRTGKT